ncbi:hypothetical protein ACP75B_15425 [Vibrio cholerae]|uniref:Uncharacterized protein n=1 Tax=Vibrio cholerae serotype O1 biovar El Tor TaxID=686 RepID=M1R2Y5_VIBCE|nr:hypothetical protein [Vibrio cholerae]AGG09406.1 hypothetical protein [Vibrio cholerae O1 biovar El Tor]EIE1178420.1 hypothetical protein [Vibrio cholerae]ELJ8458511.1 hypothetical protein [Vibrio cholerae]ELJ8523832.1 hypothetical protein [Vibrio cholerae]ELJ8735508.1 hypothetical protein [Vibrio cholerae]
MNNAETRLLQIIETDEAKWGYSEGCEVGDFKSLRTDKGKKEYFDELTHNRPIYSLIED